MKDLKEVIVIGGSGKGKRDFYFNPQEYSLYVDSDIRHIIKLITNFLYLSVEKGNIENALFFNKILYPYILFYYDVVNRIESIEKAIHHLQNLSRKFAGSKCIGLNIGEYLIENINSLFKDKYDKKEKDLSAQGKYKNFLHLVSPNSPNSPEFIAYSDENKILYEKIGKGYELFLHRLKKFDNTDRMRVIKADDELKEIKTDFINVDFTFIKLKSTNKDYTAAIEAYNTLQEVKSKLEVLESEFIIFNNFDGLHRTRLYINLLNRYLRELIALN